MLIDRDKYIIELIFNGIYGTAVYPPYMKKEEIKKVESIRRLGSAILPIMKMVQGLASRYGEEAVRAKVTPEWIMKRMGEKYPEIVEVWKANGERGQRWLKRQAEEIVNYATGKLIWNGREIEIRA